MFFSIYWSRRATVSLLWARTPKLIRYEIGSSISSWLWKFKLQSILRNAITYQGGWKICRSSCHSHQTACFGLWCLEEEWMKPFQDKWAGINCRTDSFLKCTSLPVLKFGVSLFLLLFSLLFPFSLSPYFLFISVQLRMTLSFHCSLTYSPTLDSDFFEMKVNF